MEKKNHHYAHVKTFEEWEHSSQEAENREQ